MMFFWAKSRPLFLGPSPFPAQSIRTAHRPSTAESAHPKEAHRDAIAQPVEHTELQETQHGAAVERKAHPWPKGTDH